MKVNKFTVLLSAFLLITPLCFTGKNNDLVQHLELYMG